MPHISLPIFGFAFNCLTQNYALIELVHTSLYCFTGRGLGDTPTWAWLNIVGMEQHKITLHPAAHTAHDRAILPRA
jgi:hypothetical protein